MTAGRGSSFGPEWSAGLRRGTDAELRGWVEFGLSLAEAADGIALRWFRREVQISTKPDRTFVTEADTAIETLLRERIADAYPGHGVIGEEYGTSEPDAATRWYVDPIDGTHNFMRGIPLFGTLLAVEREGELQAAVVSAPALGERWYAWRGGGAWATGPGWASGLGGVPSPRRLVVSAVTSIADAQILYGSGRDIRRSGRVPGFDGVLEAAWRERGFGDFWGYSLVAEGAAEAMVEVELSPWDAAAPTVLVEEAGGRATDLGGLRAVDSGTFLSTNGILHDELLDRLAGRR